MRVSAVVRNLCAENSLLSITVSACTVTSVSVTATVTLIRFDQKPLRLIRMKLLARVISRASSRGCERGP